MNNDKKTRILLVDDEHDITFGLRIGLENNGFVVDAFNDPQEALSNFKAGLYDLSLIDVKMPKMNGFELYRELEKIDNKAKVCFITAFNSALLLWSLLWDIRLQTGKCHPMLHMLYAKKELFRKPGLL
jgi:CheY-like chemotaxis protein